ncbi:MAG: alpha/beta hydrolase, partial [Tepidisphaeraceae bacterium]
FADLTDVRCFYELLGSGDPLILIPGLGATSVLFEPVAGELSKSFSLILFDNRGLGRSIARRHPQHLRDYAVDVIELMDHLQLDRAHVLGLSFGGIVAQQVAIDHPGRVDRLVLVSCSNRFGPYLMEVAKLLGHALRHFPKEQFRRMVELLSVAPQYLDTHADDLDRKINAALDAKVPRMAVGRQLRCLGNRDVACESEFHITSPTLIIAGDQDMLIPACYAQAMSREIPGSEFVLLPNCGHNPLNEQPEVMVERVREFLTRPRNGRHDDRKKKRENVPLHTEEASLNG